MRPIESNNVNGGHRPGLYLTRIVLVLTFATMLLGGCAKSDSGNNVDSNQNAGDQIAAALETPTAILGTIPVATPMGTPTLLPRDRSATKIARFENEQATVLAQATTFALGTPYPSNPPPTRPRRPAITPVPGISVNCVDASKRFDFGNCWNEAVEGRYVFAQSGALPEDPLQGVLRVYTESLHLRDMSPIEWYYTPTRAGKVFITDVAWPLLTLRTIQGDPPTTFVFDLATRQWISPPSTPGPSPSALISPVPSVSPLPTQSP